MANPGGLSALSQPAAAEASASADKQATAMGENRYGAAWD
jgi:hypothetical protein